MICSRIGLATRLAKRCIFSARALSTAAPEWVTAFGDKGSLSISKPTLEDLALVRRNIEEGLLNGSSPKLLQELRESMHGTRLAMRLRDAVLALKKQDSKSGNSSLIDEYKIINAKLLNFLSISFSSDNLQFGRVTFDECSGMMLEKVAEQDAVLTRVRTLRDLKKRLGEGRRCYSLMHPNLPNDPVAFIHVALTQELAPSLHYLDDHCKEGLVPSHAMFYSVNAPFSALGGLDLATRIIKLALGAVREEFPTIETFSTLSPVPGFMGWLNTTRKAPFPEEIEKKMLEIALEMGGEKMRWEPGSDDGDKALSFLSEVLSEPSWAASSTMREHLNRPLHWLGSYYLMKQKQGGGTKGLPYDPVARFHLRNGASLHRVNSLGNLSRVGLERSGGLMCNYLYSLPHLAERHQDFVNSDSPGHFHVDPQAARVVE